MVIRNEEPDIAVAIGGDDLSSLPVATAVPATAVDPNKNIERTIDADGSLIVKVTTTSHQPNGYRKITIEYFHVPRNMAGAVMMSMDATGEPPSSLYMTKMEQQVLPPGTSEVTIHAPRGSSSNPTSQSYNMNPTVLDYTHTPESINSVAKRWILHLFTFVLIFITVATITSSVLRRNHEQNEWSSPSPPLEPILTPNSTCEDTPGWVDGGGFGCDYYETKYYSGMDRCEFSDRYEGPMGSALVNCCTCGGVSTPVSIIDPAIEPLPRPTQPSACVDTPDWVDVDGSDCETYEILSYFCELAYIWEGDMGAADANCCICGGGTIPSNSSSSSSSSNSQTPTTSSTAGPTIVSEDEVMGLNTTNDSDESI